MRTSSSNLPVLAFEPRWSPQRLVALVIQAVICMVIPWLVPYWPVTVRCLVSIIALILLAIGYQRAGWWGSNKLIRVVWQQSGEWRLQFASINREAQQWELMQGSYVSAWLIRLRWRDGRSHAQLIVLPGELPRNAWRQWQARLKLHAHNVAPETTDV